MALLMALVMLAIATTLAAGIWYNAQLSVARINNLQKNYQAKHYSQGLLLWASDLLREDYAQDEYTHDSHLDGWRQGIQGMLVEDAVLSGQLTGLSGRFNVNNLVINGVVQEWHLAYLQRLLALLELDVGIADQIIDWIDPDQIPRPKGAEDFVYLAKAPGYQTPGGPMKHIGELALLDGVDADTFQLLSGYLIALPLTTDQPTRMNVNTMRPAALSALDLAITNELALRLYQNGQADFLNLQAFFDHPAIQYRLQGAREELTPRLSTQTRYLQASSRIQMEQHEYQMHALLQRQEVGHVRVLSRSMRPYLVRVP
nr:type II secretion system minor pseudopilin GspK [Marinicella sp. NBU2979]